MSDMDKAGEARKKRDEEIQAAEQALAEEHLSEARQHLHKAESLPGSARLSRLRDAISIAEQNRLKRARMAFWGGLFIALPCYLLLSFTFTPVNAQTFWAVLAFLIIPFCVGFPVGRWKGYDSTARERFWTAFRACGVVVFFYTAFNLMILHARVGYTGDSGGVFFTGMLVSCVYTLIAGLVAGTVSAKLTWREAKKEVHHGTAS